MDAFLQNESDFNMISLLTFGNKVNSIESGHFNGEEKHPHSFDAVQQAALKINLY